MKLNIHAPSALIGLGLAGLVGILSAQSIVGSPGVEVTRIVEPVQVAPHPRDFVRLYEGIPITVPPGRILVVTGLGSKLASPATTASINVNGTTEASFYFVSPPAGSGIGQLPTPGIAAVAGDLVTVGGGTANPNDARAWGYLVDA